MTDKEYTYVESLKKEKVELKHVSLYKKPAFKVREKDVWFDQKGKGSKKEIRICVGNIALRSRPFFGTRQQSVSRSAVITLSGKNMWYDRRRFTYEDVQTWIPELTDYLKQYSEGEGEIFDWGWIVYTPIKRTVELEQLPTGQWSVKEKRD